MAGAANKTKSPMAIQRKRINQTSLADSEFPSSNGKRNRLKAESTLAVDIDSLRIAEMAVVGDKNSGLQQYVAVYS